MADLAARLTGLFRRVLVPNRKGRVDPERAREGWSWGGWLESVLLDVRHALRMLQRDPAFAVTAVTSLAVGIGLSVAVFSVINACFLQPLPGVRAGNRLVGICQQWRGGQGSFTSASYPEFEFFREHARAFDGMAASAQFPTTFEAAGAADRMPVELVSPNYFTVLGIDAAAGRVLAPGDAAQPVAVLGYEFWTQRFARDPGVVGKAIRIGSGEFTVLGVVAPSFRGIDPDQRSVGAWVPVGWWRRAVTALADDDVANNWFNQSFGVWARLKPGWSVALARDDLARVEAQLEVAHPERDKGWRSADAGLKDLRAAVFPLSAGRVSPESGASAIGFLGLLAGVAVLVFVTACVNVAGLLLARASNREHEVAVRHALGAGASRLARQLATEHLVLAAAGGVGGLLVARWTTALLLSFGGGFGARSGLDAGIDGRVLLFTAGMAALSAVAVTPLPLRALRRGAFAARAGSPARAGRAGEAWTRDLLVAAQSAVSLLLIAFAGLFLATLRNARAVDVTVRSEQVLLADLNLADGGYTDAGEGARLYSRLLDRVVALPGVRRAAYAFVVPLGRRRGGTAVELGEREVGTTRTVGVGFNIVSDRYFETIGIPLLAGRAFGPDDGPTATPVAIINEEMAERYFGGRDPIGQRFTLLWKPASSVEVVGVVRDGPFRSFRASKEPTVYVPLAQRYMPGMTLEVRAAAGDGALLAPSVRRELASIDPHLPLTNVRTARAHFESTLERERMMASFLAVLAGIALVLLAVGAYGTLSYVVSRRAREIGIRMALGAARAHVVRAVVGRTLSFVALGAALGLAGAFGCAWLVRSFLFGTGPTDLGVFAAATAALALVCALASYVPARRASRVDPVTALRCD